MKLPEGLVDAGFKQIFKDIKNQFVISEWMYLCRLCILVFKFLFWPSEVTLSLKRVKWPGILQTRVSVSMIHCVYVYVYITSQDHWYNSRLMVLQRAFTHFSVYAISFTGLRSTKRVPTQMAFGQKVRQWDGTRGFANTTIMSLAVK